MPVNISMNGRISSEIERRVGPDGQIGAWCALATSIDCREHGELSEDTMWFWVAAYGDVAVSLLKHSEGDLIFAAGVLQRSVYAKDGAPVEALGLVCEQLVSSKTIRAHTNKPIESP